MTLKKFEENNYEKVPPVTNSEMRKAINELASGKSPGADEIPIEILKDVGDEMITTITAATITAVCNAIWDKGVWPNRWKQSIYVLLPKKGDPRICSNNQTIALISHASKILLKIIQWRLESYKEKGKVYRRSRLHERAGYQRSNRKPKVDNGTI
ncbi:endonuclease-reverse transcriptase [Elysia marginata]|uniref:Endonuclease-reverse transcriptase n=1 Tax=Elysia marginata TaxID=1093978 RepID=A0AAV4IT11_9GAST|nr:endonuclease-reverse transcriptase [Elysia marginata]